MSDSQSTAGVRRFLEPGKGSWKDLEPVLSDEHDDSDRDRQLSQLEESRDTLKKTLLSALQMPSLVVLAGSGTSIGEPGGPSMWDLWDHCMLKDPGTDREKTELTEDAAAVVSEIRFDQVVEGENIESFLSRCDAYLSINSSEAVSIFAKGCKAVILQKCQGFLFDGGSRKWSDENLEGHEIFLHRLSRRRTRDPRLKIFTTNYDLCFERAAALKGLVTIDGFSFSKPRRFSPIYFGYDVVKRSSSDSEVGDYLEGVFQLLKLHGSVNWERGEGDEISEAEQPDPDKACLIYPARGKYQQSYLQPHLELMSQYLACLRQSNTCLIVTGFGFNDDHLSEPILAAITSNPQLRVIVADYKAQDYLEGRMAKASPHWSRLKELSDRGENIWFINASFKDFAKMIPDLKALSSAELLQKAIKNASR
jgi:hypothetical protein